MSRDAIAGVASRAIVLGLASDLGAEQRGSVLAPGHILRALQAPAALGHAELEWRTIVEHPLRVQLEAARDDVYYRPEIGKCAERVADLVTAELQGGRHVLAFGGDHSVSLGTGRASRRFAERLGRPLAVIWIDAHPDLNTPRSSPSGRAHGMALTSLVRPSCLGTDLAGDEAPASTDLTLVVGVCAEDPGEVAHAESWGVSVVRWPDGASTIDARVAEHVRHVARTNAVVHLSIDLDVLDPAVAPGVNAPVREGMSLDTLERLLSIVLQGCTPAVSEVVEFNPAVDEGDRTLAVIERLAAQLGGPRTPP